MRLIRHLSKDYNLILVSVLHRHGDRSPVREQLYPNTPLKDVHFHPIGEGGLTNLGKQQLYEVGQALRKRYDSFLGSLFDPDEVEIVSSDLVRTQMSVLSLCASLFVPAPKQQWSKHLNWQPVPYTVIPVKFDIMLRGIKKRIYPEYSRFYDEVLKTDFNQKLVNKYSDVLNYLQKHAGYEKAGIKQAYDLLMNFTAELSMGLTLPDWAKDIYPDVLEEIGAHQYTLCTYTTEMRKFAGGRLAERIVNQCFKKVNNKSRRKLLIFSGHESTIGYQLRFNNIVDSHIPPLASYMIWELLENNSNYFVRIFYQNYKQDEPKELKTVPLNDFAASLEPFFPDQKDIFLEW